MIKVFIIFFIILFLFKVFISKTIISINASNEERKIGTSTITAQAKSIMSVARYNKADIISYLASIYTYQNDYIT